MSRFEVAALTMVMLAAASGELRPQLFPAGRLQADFAFTSISSLGDADGDGIPDLLARPPTGGILILRGSATGFLPPVLVQEGGAFGSLNATDVNGDAVPDLVATSGDGVVTVRVGIGGMQFGPPVDSTMPTIFSIGPLFADVNGDGRADLVADSFHGVSENKLVVAFGQADGTFVQGGDVLAGGAFKRCELRDVNGDGLLDIGGVLKAGSKVRTSVLLGVGDGTFGSPIKSFVTGRGQKECIDAAGGDLDADGTPDLAVIVHDDFSAELHIVLMRGLGDGTFESAASFASPAEDTILAVGDVNADGLPDLLCGGSLGAAAGSTGTLHAWRNDGAFAFTSEPRVLVGGQPSKLMLVDADHDGRLDAVIGQYPFPLGPFGSAIDVTGAQGSSGASPYVGAFPSAFTDFGLIRGRGDGTFASAAEVLAGAPVENVVIADLNGDGRADLVLSCHADTQQVRFAAGAGDGSFAPAIEVKGVTPTALLTSADLDGDGHADFVFAALDGLRTQHGTGLLDAEGAPAFEASQWIGPAGVTALGIADLDGNGTQDLVTVRDADQVVSILSGSGDGTFLSTVTYPCGLAATALAIADVTADGRLDLLLASATDHRLAVLVGQLGGFSPPVLTELLVPRDRIASADLDGDGLPDVMLASSKGVGLTQLRGLGTGHFSTVPAPATIGPVSALFLADVTGDQHPDLLATHLVAGALTVWPGAIDGSFGTPQYFRTRSSPACAAVGDLDGNGLLDAVTGCLDGSAWILANQLSEWTDLGGGLAASFGTPQLQASGPLNIGQSVSMLATGVPTPTFGVLIIGLGTSDQHFAGGTLVPTPNVAVEMQPDHPLTETWPAGVAPGTPVCVQAWFATHTASGAEISASRALLAHSP